MGDHYDSLSEDYRRQCQSDDQVQNMELANITTYLQSMGNNLEDLDLPKINADVNLQFGSFREVEEEYSIVVEDKHLHAETPLISTIDMHTIRP